MNGARHAALAGEAPYFASKPINHSKQYLLHTSPYRTYSRSHRSATPIQLQYGRVY